MILLEIERKFLIRRNNALFQACDEKIDIVQTYLVKREDGLQRRVRKIVVNGAESFTYTEKNFISATTREENERSIERDEYERLLIEADSEFEPVIKTRLIINYSGQHFEVDVYPFSDELATMELEIPDESTKINLPPFVDVIKEVTGDKNYSNSTLSKTKTMKI